MYDIKKSHENFSRREIVHKIACSLYSVLSNYLCFSSRRQNTDFRLGVKTLVLRPIYLLVEQLYPALES